MTDEHLDLLSVTNGERDATIRRVEDNADAIFTWDYEKGARPALNKLYEKAKHSQWNGETDLDWSIEVDQEALVRQAGIDPNRELLRSSGSTSPARRLRAWGEQGVARTSAIETAELDA